MSLNLETDTDTLRQKTLDAGRRHKASWIELGQFLFTIHKDKLYKRWGFLSFEAYCIKELGLKQTTAQKILKSYSFLEKEAPRVIEERHSEQDEPARSPHYESVNLLRLAKENQKITPDEFTELKQSVLKEGREAKEVRDQMKKILAEKDDLDSDEVRMNKNRAAVRRLVGMIRNAERELRQGKMLPAYLLDQMSELAEKLQNQMQ